MENNNAILSIPRGRVRCPWLGVNVPGARPITLATETVRASLHGVTVTDCAVIDTERAGGYGNGNGWGHKTGQRTRALEVTFTHGKRGHGKTTFYDLGEVTLSVHNWAEKQRERLAKNGNGHALTAKARQVGVIVRRLEKEKSRLYVRRPLHPLLPRESHVYQGSANYLRTSEQRWHDEKAKRKQLAAIAGNVLKHRITATTAYQKMRDAGFTFDRLSDLRVHERDWLAKHGPESDHSTYWKHVYRFAHGLLAEVSRAKDYTRDPAEGDEFTRHQKSLVEYLADRRQAESLDAQIASLRALAA